MLRHVPVVPPHANIPGSSVLNQFPDATASATALSRWTDASCVTCKWPILGKNSMQEVGFALVHLLMKAPQTSCVGWNLGIVSRIFF